LKQVKVCLITSAKFYIKSKMHIKGKLLKVFKSFFRICEEESYEGIVEIINEVREALEEFDQVWITYE